MNYVSKSKFCSKTASKSETSEVSRRGRVPGVRQGARHRGRGEAAEAGQRRHRRGQNQLRRDDGAAPGTVLRIHELQLQQCLNRCFSNWSNSKALLYI